jgi:(p)ppGpp synthase/HD superfamily hydrolase
MIDLAIGVALKAHQNQFRKGTDIPYITHPLAVGIILAKAGCSDDVIAAGILHDTVRAPRMDRPHRWA